MGAKRGQEQQSGAFWGPFAARDQPYDHRDVLGCHLGTILDPVVSIWDPFGLPLGSHFAHFWGRPFFHKKGGSRDHPDIKTLSVFGAILAPFFIMFHNFSEDVKNRFWQYLTVLLKVFALQMLSFWDPVSVTFSVRFWTPKKGSPREVSESPGGAPRGWFLVRRGEDLGGGFVDSSRFR